MEIPVKILKKDLFKYYLRFLDPVFNFRNKEIDVAAVLLEYHFNNRSVVDVDKTLLSTAKRREFREMLDMSEPSFNNYISKLKKKGFLRYRDGTFTITKGLSDHYNDARPFDVNVKFSIYETKARGSGSRETKQGNGYSKGEGVVSSQEPVPVR